MKESDILKVGIVLIVLFFVGGFLFRVLFKIGLLVLLVLGIAYLLKKVLY